MWVFSTDCITMSVLYYGLYELTCGSSPHCIIMSVLYYGLHELTCGSSPQTVSPCQCYVMVCMSSPGGLPSTVSSCQCYIMVCMSSPVGLLHRLFDGPEADVVPPGDLHKVLRWRKTLVYITTVTEQLLFRCLHYHGNRATAV